MQINSSIKQFFKLHLLAITSLVFLSFGCGSPKIIAVATASELPLNIFTEEIHFDFVEDHIYIDVKLYGKTYTFLFDSAWEITALDKNLRDQIEFESVKKVSVSGSSIKNQKMELGYLSSLSIGAVSFNHIGIGLQDLSFIKNPLTNNRKISGIIGTNILRTAHWQINYVDSTIRFSNELENLASVKDAFAIKMTPRNSSGWGYGKIDVKLNRSQEQFVFDTGSSGGFTGDFDLLNRLKSDASIPNESLAEGLILDTISIGKIRLTQTPLSIEKGVAQLIGNVFLKDYVVTMDWAHNILYLEKN